MNKLEKLIQELCPDGVEYKTVQEVVGVNRGRRLTKSQLNENGKYDVYHGSKDTTLGRYDDFNAPANTVIVVNTGGIGGVKHIDTPFWCSDGSFWLGQSEYLDSKFLFYYLVGYEDYFASQKQVGGVPTINRNVVENFKIPVPPIEVQREIVSILDKMESLATALATECASREKQYSFYRNKLLDFSPENVYLRKLISESCSEMVEKVRLGDVCIVSDGFPFDTAIIQNEGVHPIIKISNIQNNVVIAENSFCNKMPDKIKESQKLNGGEILVAMSGATCGKSGYNELGNAVANQRVAIIRNTPKINNHYLKHIVLNENFYNYLQSKGTGTQKNISKSDIEKYPIALPPLEIQNKIVEVLDNFDKICHDLKIGLPKEIELRNKQYEFYRNSLLNFNDIENNNTHTHTHK